MKAKRGKPGFDRPYTVWLDEALLADERIELLPLAPRFSLAAVELAALRIRREGNACSAQLSRHLAASGIDDGNRWNSALDTNSLILNRGQAIADVADASA